MALTQVNPGLLDTSGNVGIGTSSPNAKLEVYGQRIRINATPDPGAEFANTTTVKGYVFYDTTADVMTMRHASASGISVNSSGNITTPSSAAFQVYGATSPVSNGNKVAWPSSKFNRGNHFDNTNSRFTAPVTGIYWMSVIFHLTTTNSPARPSFRVNGSDYSVGGDAAQTVTNVTGAEITSILQIHMTLTAGDYVEVFARTGGGSLNFYTGHTWWSGNLIG